MKAFLLPVPWLLLQHLLPLHSAPFYKVGCTSAIQENLIALSLHYLWLMHLLREACKPTNKVLNPGFSWRKAWRTALPALCASCTGCLLEARSTSPHACWGIGFILSLKWRVFIYLILYVTHLIVNGLQQLMYISKAARAQSPLCSLLTGISPLRFHIYSDAILTSDDNRDCTIYLPVYFFYCSAVIFWHVVLFAP